jgi:hypothetical protein
MAVVPDTDELLSAKSSLLQDIYWFFCLKLEYSAIDEGANMRFEENCGRAC